MQFCHPEDESQQAEVEVQKNSTLELIAEA